MKKKLIIGGIVTGVCLLFVGWYLYKYILNPKFLTLESIFQKDEAVSKYINDVKIRLDSADNPTDNEYYIIKMRGNNKFGKLSTKEKYYVLSNFKDNIESDMSNDTILVSKVQIKYNNTTYAMDAEDYSDTTMDINDKDYYMPKEVDKLLTQSIKEDENKTTSSTENRSDLLTDEQKINAWGFSQELVKDKLKAPSTADFPSYEESSIKYINSQITVSSYVDAENSFGAKIRSYYTVILDKDMNVIDVSIQ